MQFMLNLSLARVNHVPEVRGTMIYDLRGLSLSSPFLV